MARYCLLLIVCTLSSCLAVAQASGHITGTVLDQDGELVSDAKLCLAVRSGASQTINCDVARSDKNGQFQIDNLKNGTYYVFAVNDAKGYSIQNQSPGEQVVLTPADASPQITISLHSPGGILRVAVTDKFTGQPVKNGWVSYLSLEGEASGSSVFSSGSDGQIIVTIPTELDLVVIVSAKGYKGWVYTDPSNPARPVLRLHSAESRTLDVQLEPHSVHQ